MAKCRPLSQSRSRISAAPISLDRMNLLFTMTNNQRQPDALPHPALKLLFLPDEEVDLKASNRDPLNARLHVNPLRATPLSAISSISPVACHAKCRRHLSSGGDRRDRTDDLKLAKLPLSQLSYVPKLLSAWQRKRGGPGQHRSRCFLAKAPVACLAKLPKAICLKWWAWKDLNFRPHAYQARALTS